MHEAVDVLELAIDRRETDVGHLVERLEALHDQLTDLAGADLTFEGVLHDLLDLADGLFQIRHADRTLLAGAHHAAQDLVAIERLAAVILLHHHDILKIDVPCIFYKKTRSRFAISCGMGFDAAVCHEVGITPMKKILNRFGLGKLVYLFVALKQLLFLNPSQVSVNMDGNSETWSKVYFIAVMNQKYEGGGFKFCPNASSSDGMLDVIVVEGLSKLKVLFCLPTAFFGRHTRFRGIHIYQCRDISVESAVPLAIHKDGESGGIHTTFSVSMEPEQIQMIVPDSK